MDLSYFQDKKDFYQGLKRLFDEINVPVNYITETPVKAEKLLVKSYKKDNPAFSLIDDIFILGMVDDAAFKGERSIDYKQIKDDYDGIMIFGVTLHSRENNLMPTRSQLAEITRAINREFHYAPVVVVYRYEDCIALANSERLKYKQAWREGEKVGKVALLRDVNVFESHTGHLKILQELVIQRSGSNAINSFGELYEYWQSVFNVSVLNKMFYKELSNWYFWALKKVYFPGASIEGDQNSIFNKEEKVKEHNAQNLIRLLTRILFIWFIKEKKLIPEELFEEKYLKDELLKNFNPQQKRPASNTNDSRYYRAILQNLFFATLNQEMGKREFRKPGQHMNVTNLMRYESYFKDSRQFINLVENVVPFMNGGLFECLDKPDPVLRGKMGGDIIIYQDGFSDRDDNVLKVPDYIFFGSEEQVDLSEDYGSSASTYKRASVSGLINILQSYKFTITENTPIEEDIALDPELLGKVFENLLASYNPETKTTARKQTGSFYTPREIVNYMVDESLKAYLMHKLADDYKEQEELETKLHELLSFENNQPFEDELIKNKIINLIDNCKIHDPACGSGAFPMGTLQKMVHILKKLDPNNEKWKLRQIEKAESIEDADIREKTINDIEEAFNNNELDYGRKLYLIENCIYGVDIQPIAIQISKLRFFISLIVEQKVDKNKDNYGVRALPNLETKFVAANTLISIENSQGQMSLENKEISELTKKLKLIRSRIFNAKTPTTKRKLREEDKELRERMRDLLIECGWDNITARQLASWDPYDQNTSSPFFDMEWMFGINDGFNVVIGNPPYIDSENMVKIFPELRTTLRNNYITTKGNWDIFVVFIEKGLYLTKYNGTLIYILPNKLISAKYTESLRSFLSTYTINEMLDYSSVDVFKEADVYPLVIRVTKTADKRSVSTKKMTSFTDSLYENIINKEVFYKDIYWDKFFFNPDVVDVILKMSKYNGLEDQNVIILGASTVSEAYEIKKVIKEYKLQNKYKKFINTGTIEPFESLWGLKPTRYIKETYFNPIVCDEAISAINKKRLEQANSPKIIIAGMSIIIEAYYDESVFLAGKSTNIILGDKTKLAALTAILNSKIISFWFSAFFNSQSMAGGYFSVGPEQLKQIPIPKLDNDIVLLLEGLTFILQYLKKFKEYSYTTLFERVLNSIVNDLYLTERVDGLLQNNELFEIIQAIKGFMQKGKCNDEIIMNIKKYHEVLSQKKHPVMISMEKMKEVPEILIIEERSKR